MKVDPKLDTQQGQLTGRVTGAGSPQPSRTGASKSQSADQASLSNDAVRLSNLSAALSNVPEIRQDRVNAIAQALRNGSYSVSDQQIAEAMLRDYGPSGSAGK